MYRIFYDNFGQPSQIVTEYGESLRFFPETKTFDEEDILTVELREWEAENGKLDLSDRPVEPQTLDRAIANKQQEIIEAAKEAQNALVADYASAEQASWDKKVAEGKAIIASQNIKDAPTLKIEAAIFSGAMTDEDILNATTFLANAVIAKSTQLYETSAAIAGKRTLLWNAIANATTVEEVEKFIWE